MAHSIYARLVGHSRTVVTAISAILGALVALGVIPKGAESSILVIVGALVAYVTGDAYVQGKHVEAAAAVSAANTHAAANSHAAASVNSPMEDIAKHMSEFLKATAPPAGTSGSASA